MLKIGDFSRKTVISTKTLRYYDEIDLLKPEYIEFFTGIDSILKNKFLML